MNYDRTKQICLWMTIYIHRTYIQQLCEDTWCSPEDLQETINNREKWRERVRDIRASGTTRWWYIYNFYTNNLKVTIFQRDRAYLFAHNKMVSSIAIYCLHAVECFQVLLSNSNNSILYFIICLHAFFSSWVND